MELKFSKKHTRYGIWPWSCSCNNWSFNENNRRKIGLTGNLMLTIGLVTEAIIFALSAFDVPEEDPNWALVYPELEGGSTSGSSKESPQGCCLKN